MEDSGTLSFEDLEPEGEFTDETGDSVGTDDEFDEFTLGPLGDYEFGENDEVAEFEALVADELLDEDQFFYEDRLTRPGSALRRGGRAKVSSLPKDNGRKPRGRELAGVPTDACSANVREAHQLMNGLASAAAASQNQLEAMGHVAAMVPIAIGLEPNAFRALWPSIPALVRGAMDVTRLLHRRPTTRPRLKYMPGILRETAAQLAGHALGGRTITQSRAAKVLAGVTQKVLSRHKGPRARAHRSRRYQSQPYDFY